MRASAGEPLTTSRWSAAGFFLLRTPLLAYSALADRDRLFMDVTAGSQSADGSSPLETLLDPVTREAVYLASPSLLDSLDRWYKEPASRRGTAAGRSLASYLVRMAGRPTPFGLFAGVTLGWVGERTEIRLKSRSHYRRQTRIQMRFLRDLCEYLLREPAIRRELSWWPNPTLLRAGASLRYVQAYPSERHQDLERYETVVCERTSYLDDVLSAAAGGAGFRELARGLAEREEAAVQEAEQYLEELIESQVLVSDLQPVLTGLLPEVELAARLGKIPSTAKLGAQLRETINALCALDRGGLGQPLGTYRRIERALQSLAVPSREVGPLEVALIKPAQRATIAAGVVDEILDGVGLLLRLGRPVTMHWRRFRQKFEAHFGDREVPLLEALETEIGVQFSASRDLHPDLQGVAPRPRRDPHHPPWRVGEQKLLRRVASLAPSERELDLEPEILTALGRQPEAPLPPCFTVLATIIAASGAAVDRGDYRFRLDGFGLSSDLLNRHAHAHRGLLREVRKLRAQEESLYAPAVLAHLAHYPMHRADGNVVSRPDLGGYEIVCAGRSGLPKSRQIPLADLLVSVRGTEVVLRSRRLGRRVLPILGSAHDFSLSGNLPVYQFLAALRLQALPRLPLWSWGPVFGSLPFLPRLVHGRLIIAPARWRLDESELDLLRSRRGEDAWAAVQQIRQQRGLPRYVALSQHDRRLPVDLDSPLAVAGFCRQCPRRQEAILEEMLPSPNELWVSGPEGGFRHEILIPYLRQTAASAISVVTPKRSGSSRVQQTFLPGDRWLYARLYTSGSVGDRFLVEKLGPWLGQVQARSTLDCWFFVRMTDDEEHLRLRLRCQSAAYASLLDGLRQLVEDSSGDGVWRLQLDTYEREIDRYGGEDAIGLAEQLFHADSEAILELLQRREGHRLPWTAAAVSAITLLTDFGLDCYEQLQLVGRLRDAYEAEFSSDPEFRHRAGAHYRRQRQHLRALLAPESDLQQTFKSRSLRLSSICSRYQQLATMGELTRHLNAIIASIVHLSLNRILRGDLRAQEAVVYDWLYRHLRAQVARGKQARPLVSLQKRENTP